MILVEFIPAESAPEDRLYCEPNQPESAESARYTVRGADESRHGIVADLARTRQLIELRLARPFKAIALDLEDCIANIRPIFGQGIFADKIIGYTFRSFDRMTGTYFETTFPESGGRAHIRAIIVLSFFGEDDIDDADTLYPLAESAITADCPRECRPMP